MNIKKIHEEIEESMNNAAQISALVLLTKAAKLNEKIECLIDGSNLQPILLLGILESQKARLIERINSDLREIKG